MSGISIPWAIVDVSMFVVLINVPLGRLRADAKKYSWRNFGCIFAPVPMVVAIRIMAGLSIKVAPLFLGAAILGQRLGMKMASKPYISG